MFNFNYETRYGDYKDFETIKPAVILDIIQDISIRDSANCGYNLIALRDRNLAWLMQGINVRFEKPIRTFSPIEAYTAVKAFHGATSERGCIIKQSGEVIAKSIANWFIFDIENMRPCRIPEDMLERYKFHDFGDDFFSYQKPELYEFEKAEYTVRVSNKELDTNKHLNNQKGAEILMDALPFEFCFNRVSILYKKPAYLGDELEVCVRKIQSGYYVHLQTKDKEICVAGTFENAN